MKPALCLVLSSLFASTGWPADQAPYVPPELEHIYSPSDRPTEIPRESATRKGLFEILRPAMRKLAEEKKLKVAGLQFEGSLRAFKNWVLFSGKVLDDRGAEVRFDPEARPENRCEALFLQTKANGWVLVDAFAGDPGEFNHELRFERFSVPRQLLPHLRDLTSLSGEYTFNPSDTDESAIVTVKFRRNPDKTSTTEWLADGKMESRTLEITVDFRGALVSIEGNGAARVTAQFFAFQIHNKRLDWLPAYDRPLFGGE